MPAFITSPDFVIGLLSLLFTVLILSYAVGDNPAFRLAIHAFIGIAAGYVAAIVLLEVIANKMVLPLFSGDLNEKILVVIPLILGLFLLTKLSSRIEWLGRPVVAFLVGTGAAAAVAGAMMGTIYPQLMGSINMFERNKSSESIIGSAVILLGTVATLAYFKFTVLGKKASTSTGRRGMIANAAALIGQIFIAITLGTLFAGVFSAALTALVDRIEFIILFIDQFLRPIQ
jgi:hypothetical protein